MFLDVFRCISIIVLKYAEQETSLFSSRSVRATSSRPTCWYTTPCFHHLPPLLYQMLRRQNPQRAAVCSMESCLFCQLVRQAAFPEPIPLGARKTPGYQACVHKRCGNWRPGATLCKTSKIRIIRYIFRHIQQNLAPGGSLSYSHSTVTNAKWWGLIINRFAASIGSTQ